MTTQLKGLLLLQEVDALLEDLGDAATRESEKALGFSVGPTAGLRAERARIAQGLYPEVVEWYEQVRRRHARAVAPSRRGVCLGCFIVRPTRSACRHHGLDVCERCGRILFRLEEQRPPAPPAPEAPEAPAGAKRRRTRSAAPPARKGRGKSAP